MKCRGIVSLLNYGRQTFEALLLPILFSSLDCLMVCSYAQTGLCRVSKRNYYFPDVNLLLFRKRLTVSAFRKRETKTRGMQRSPEHSTVRAIKDFQEVVKKTILVHGMWQRLGHDCYTRMFSRMIKRLGLQSKRLSLYEVRINSSSTNGL